MWYSAGTVAVANGSTAVTGTGSAFVGNIAAGWGFVAPDGRLYEIASITSATALVLATPYQGATAGGQAYAVIPTQGADVKLLTALQLLITNYQTVYDGAGAGKFGDGLVASPGISWVADPDTGLRRAAANHMSFVTGGVDRLQLTAAAAQLDLPLTGSAVTTDASDATAGRALRNHALGGAFGLGLTGTATLRADFDTLTTPAGMERFDATTIGPRPAGVLSTQSGYLITKRFSASNIIQTLCIINNALVTWARRYVSGAWTAWEAVSLPILGTVAQSGGLPTGALIETGSNANGIYRRFACGMQICWSFDRAFANANTALGSMFRSAGVTWTFPAAFVAGTSPVVVGNVDDVDAVLTCAAPVAASVSLRIMSAVTKAGALNARASAIGRWFA